MASTPIQYTDTIVDIYTPEDWLSLEENYISNISTDQKEYQRLIVNIKANLDFSGLTYTGFSNNAIYMQINGNDYTFKNIKLYSQSISKFYMLPKIIGHTTLNIAGGTENNLPLVRDLTFENNQIVIANGSFSFLYVQSGNLTNGVLSSYGEIKNILWGKNNQVYSSGDITFYVAEIETQYESRNYIDFSLLGISGLFLTLKDFVGWRAPSYQLNASSSPVLNKCKITDSFCNAYIFGNGGTSQCKIYNSITTIYNCFSKNFISNFKNVYSFYSLHSSINVSQCYGADRIYATNIKTVFGTGVNVESSFQDSDLLPDSYYYSDTEIAQPTSNLSGSPTFLINQDWTINNSSKLTSIEVKGNPNGWFSGQNGMTIEASKNNTYTLKITSYQNFKIEKIDIPAYILVSSGNTSYSMKIAVSGSSISSDRTKEISTENAGGASVESSTSYSFNLKDGSSLQEVKAGDTITIKVTGVWVQAKPYYTDNKDTSPDYAISGFSGIFSGGCQMTINFGEEGTIPESWIMDDKNEGYPQKWGETAFPKYNMYYKNASDQYIPLIAVQKTRTTNNIPFYVPISFEKQITKEDKVNV